MNLFITVILIIFEIESRFVILKAVMRKDLIETLPLPRRILDYLSNKNFLSEQIESDSSQSQVSSMNINIYL